MSKDQRSILSRRKIDYSYEEDDPRRFDHYWAIGLSAVLILLFEFVF